MKNSSSWRIYFPSANKEAEKEAKLAQLKDKRNAIMLVLRSCSGKLDNLKSVGAPTHLEEIKEQQSLVQVRL